MDTYRLSRCSGPESTAEAGKRCGAGDNGITFRDGLEITTSRLRLTADSVFWQDAKGIWHVARSRDVAQITHSDHQRGMLDGIGWGAGTGAVLGLIFALPASTQHGGFEVFDPFIAIPVLAATGAVPGAILGAVVGHRTVVEYDSSEFPAGSSRPIIHNSAGWPMPETSDTTHNN